MAVITGEKGQTRLVRRFQRGGLHSRFGPGLPATQPCRVFGAGPVRWFISSQGRISMQADMRSGPPERAQQHILRAAQHGKARHQHRPFGTGHEQRRNM